MPEDIDELNYYDYGDEFDEGDAYHIAEQDNDDDERMIDMMHMEDIFRFSPAWGEWFTPVINARQAGSGYPATR